MTFSRPAIERLIATVESGLQYGELGPYAVALRDCLLAIDARDAIEAASQRTIESGNEAFRTLRDEWHRDRETLRAERDNARWADETRKKACEALITERDAMRQVVEAAERYRDRPGQDASHLDLLSTVDAYRASKVRP